MTALISTTLLQFFISLPATENKLYFNHSEVLPTSDLDTWYSLPLVESEI